MLIKAVKKFTFVKDLLAFSNTLLLKTFYTLFLVLTVALRTLKVAWLRALSFIKVIVKSFLGPWYRLNYVSPNSYIKVLPPVSQHVILFGEIGL